MNQKCNKCIITLNTLFLKFLDSDLIEFTFNYVIYLVIPFFFEFFKFKNEVWEGRMAQVPSIR